MNVRASVCTILLMKVALGQINTTVGDIAGNEAKILAAYERASREGADIALVPELALTGLVDDVAPVCIG